MREWGQELDEALVGVRYSDSLTLFMCIMFLAMQAVFVSFNVFTFVW